MTRPPQPPPARFAWCGYAACALGLLYALVSAYWAAGGTAGLDTVGGELERLARERAPAILAVLWLTVALKLAGAALGLAVARDWGRRLPRPGLLTALCWVAAVVLVVYGGALVAGQALVEAGAVAASADMDWHAFRWHLYLWDPWFLVWGLLLAAATRGRGRQQRRS